MNLTRRAQLGIGLVELMVGITIGLIVAAGASMVAVNQINEHRRLMLETQIQQDLRAAADVLQQDLRRAGFRGLSERSVWAPPANVGAPGELPAQLASDNPYSSITITKEDQLKVVSYLYARRDVTKGYEATGVPRDNEHFGFKWDKKSQGLYVQLGMTAGQPNWQPITDPESVQITDFDINIDPDPSQTIDLGAYCEKACNSGPAAAAPVCPSLQVRRISFIIVGQAKHDPNVKRTLKGTDRVRADAITGACP